MGLLTEIYKNHQKQKEDKLNFLKDVVNQNPGAYHPEEINQAVQSIYDDNSLNLPTQRHSGYTYDQNVDPIPTETPGVSKIPDSAFSEDFSPINLAGKDSLAGKPTFTFNADTGKWEQVTIPGLTNPKQMLRFNPPNPGRPGATTTPQQRADLATLNAIDKTLSLGMPLDPAMRKRAKAAASRLGQDSSVFEEDNPTPPPTETSTNSGIEDLWNSITGKLKGTPSAAPTVPSLGSDQFKVGESRVVPGKGKFKYLGNNKWAPAK